MADPDTSPPAPSPLDALARRFRVPLGSGRLATQLLLLALVATAAGFFISPGLYTQQIPALGPESLGRPFRASSPSGFKAGHDYDIVHAGMTAQRRAEARAAVRPVYDYSPSVADDVRGAVQAAFSGARARLAEASAPPPAQPPEPRRLTRPGAARQETLEPEALEALRTEFQTRLFAHAEGLGADDLQALRAMDFSAEAENATLALLERAYTRGDGSPAYLLGTRQELQREGPQGLTLRDLRQRSEQGLPAQSPRLLDVAEAHAELCLLYTSDAADEL